MTAAVNTVNVNGTEYVRRDSRDDHFRAVYAETLLETARAALTTISEMTDADEQSSYREEAWAALEAIATEPENSHPRGDE